MFFIYLPDILVLRNITHSLDCSLVEEILAVSRSSFFLRVKFKTVFRGKLTMAFKIIAALIGITFLVSVLSATQNYSSNVLFSVKRAKLYYNCSRRLTF